MATMLDIPPKVFKMIHLFCGIGGGSLGFKNARFAWKGVLGRFENILAIDSDYGACQSYKRLVGSRVENIDLFSRDQYRRFHGKEPPEDWHEVTPEDIRRLCGDDIPDGVFTSPPCKGLSGLLPNAAAESDKYQALNELTVRGVRLMLEAFKDKPLKILLFENVPRILTRGAFLLDQITDLLKSYGYAVDLQTHDCGEIGGLGQKRKRFLLIARHKATFKPFIHKPELKPLKTIGDVLGSLPLPDDPSMGAMHRLPRLKMLTWLRLALIPAGGDWRDLQKINPDEYRLERAPIGDPRLNHAPWGGKETGGRGAWGVQEWDEPGVTVTGSSSVKGSNATCIADPRVAEKENRHQSHFRVTPYDEPAGTVTGATHVANGAAVIADPRLKAKGDSYNGSPGLYGVLDWQEQSPAVTGSCKVSSSNCPNAVADPRLTHKPRPGVYRILQMGETSGAVTGGQGVGVSNGPQAISDPRLTHTPREGAMAVSGMDKPSPTVVGSAAVTSSNGAAAIADVRLPASKGVYPNRYRIVRWNGPAPTITGDTDRYPVRGPVHTRSRVDHASGVSIADARLTCTPRGNSKGPLGVQDFGEPSSTIIGAMDIHAGAAAVADYRVPGPEERLDIPPVIISEDGTWHRPLTTLELAVLQSFPTHFEDGSPLVLHGNNDSKWREFIGNAVPPLSAKEIAEVIGVALLQNELGETFTLGATGIWVVPHTTVRRDIVSTHGQELHI